MEIPYSTIYNIVSIGLSRGCLIFRGEGNHYQWEIKDFGLGWWSNTTTKQGLPITFGASSATIHMDCLLYGNICRTQPFFHGKIHENPWTNPVSGPKKSSEPSRDAPRTSRAPGRCSRRSWTPRAKKCCAMWPLSWTIWTTARPRCRRLSWDIFWVFVEQCLNLPAI